MLFNSAPFIVLFLITYAFYWLLPLKEKHYLIIAASIAFYGWYSIPFLLLFLVLILFNYYISMALIERKSKALLWTAIGIDLGLLAFFKYFYLFAESFGSLISVPYLEDLRQNWISDYGFEIILPIAISFYTFQIVAFVVDSWRGTIKEKVSLRHYYVFILFFPQFVAGPIMRSVDFLPQIDRPSIDRERLLRGVFLLLSGVIKKVLLADRLGAITGPIWHNYQNYDAVYLILIMPAFLAQIYMDFSGYTDMARGLAYSLGYDIPENFRAPFLSKSMSELWSRWHITLSTWLRDYIYFPLGGSRGSELLTIRNLLITMSLGGLWHGATWNMFFWGLYLGVVLVAERIYTNFKLWRMPDSFPFSLIRIVRTFILFSISTLFFVPADFSDTVAIIQRILDFSRGGISDFDGILGMTIAGLLLNFLQLQGFYNLTMRIPYTLRYVIAVFLIIIVSYLTVMFGDVSGTFIYFQF